MGEENFVAEVQTVCAIDPIMIQQLTEIVSRIEVLLWALVAILLAGIMAYFTLRWLYGVVL